MANNYRDEEERKRNEANKDMNRQGGNTQNTQGANFNRDQDVNRAGGEARTDTGNQPSNKNIDKKDQRDQR